MYISNRLENVQFVIDAEGNKKAVQLDFSLWEAILSFIENHEEDASEELLNIPGLSEAIEESRQLMKSGQFVRYEDIRRMGISEPSGYPASDCCCKIMLTG